MFLYNNVDNIQICMDVPFVDHPYLIGPRGRKCQHLMDRYKSLVHFPDSNRRQNGPKLNNVVINGSSKNAEELRFQLRSRTPIRLAIQLQNFPDTYEIANRMETAITERSLPIRMNCSEDYSSAMLKTEWRNEDALINFCNEFLSSHGVLMFSTNNADVFTMALTILPVVNPWNPEISHWLIEHIFDVTGCRVFYPPKEKFSDQPPSYFIKGGSATGVLKAGKFMLGLTMFQVSFIIPNSVNLNLEKITDWQRELLVHTSIEPVYSTNNHSNNNNNNCNKNNNNNHEFLHHRAVLRSFEFCLNSVYFVRSLLLGFKKTVQSSFYNFMNDVKHLIPFSVFSDAQLYYPLYAIDDERSFNWEIVGEEFFQKFYGGPYSANSTSANKQSQNSKSLISLHPINTNLTSRLQELLNIRICENDSEKKNDLNNNSNISNKNYVVSKTVNKNNVEDNVNKNKSCSFSNIDDNSMLTNSSFYDKETSQILNYNEFVDTDNNSSTLIEVARGSNANDTIISPPPKSINNTIVDNSSQEANSTKNCLVDENNDKFNINQTNVIEELTDEETFEEQKSLALVLVSPCISSISPELVDHEDDPELQAILRRTMPCLQVTSEQVNSLDHEAISRALMTADDLAKITNSSHRPFLYAEYAVSYPAEVSLEEFQNQFKEFLKMRNRYFQVRNIISNSNKVYGRSKGRLDFSDSNINDVRSLRKSASF